MFQKLLFLSTLAITFFPACASSQAPQVGISTTTSATLPTNPSSVAEPVNVVPSGPIDAPNSAPWCTGATTFCASNHDCCSRFCFEGTCQ